MAQMQFCFSYIKYNILYSFSEHMILFAVKTLPDCYASSSS